VKYVQKYNIITSKFGGAEAAPSTYLSTALTTIVLPSLDYCDVVWAGYVYEDCCKEVGSSASNVVYQSSATALRTQLGCKL